MRHGRVLLLGILCWIAGTGADAAAQSAGEEEPLLGACVQQVHPVARSSSAVNAVGSVEDVGDLTVIEFDGDYARGLTAPRQEIAAQFYATHPDDYDFLVVFSTFEFDTGGATAFHNLILNDTAGIGLPMYDHGEAFGSAGRLQGYIDMAATGRYSFAPSSPRYQDVLTTFLHEMMHRWGMSLRFVDGAGNDSGDMIGADGAHWSYFLDTDASVMLGNDWQQQQDGSFRSVDIKHRYSPVDLYAAGFASPSEVPPLMLVRNGTGGVATDLPRLGATSGGTAEAISVEQIIAASGPRIPDAGIAQKDFTAALLLLKRPGEFVPAERLIELERFRIRAEQQFIAATDGRATLRFFTRTQGAGVRLPTVLHGSGPSTVPPGMAAAVAWLESRQANDGRWEDRPATAMRDTVAVATALTELDPGFPGLARARAWIAANAAGNLDLQSWKLLGTGSVEDAAMLEAAQGADGGFAIESGWSSSAYDTVLVAAALADSSPDSPALASALLKVGTSQNPDGSYGVAEGGQGRVLPTLRAASMLAGESDPSNVLRLQRAADWIASRRQQDGGIGSAPGTSSLSETIETYALAGRLPMAALIATGIRDHVRQSQQVDGDWGGSVYLTAKAVLAYAHDQRSNLAIAGVPTASPDVVHDGQRLALGVTVTNLGNAPAATSVLRWYDGDPDQGGVQIGTDVPVPDLAAGSRTIASFEWDTTGQAGDHVLWAAVDAVGALEESSEQDNRSAIEVTVLPPADLPDLVLLASDFVATPSSVSTLPGNIHISGLVRNVGTQDAVGAVLRLEEQSRPGTALAEAIVAVPARGTAVVDLDLTTTSPSTLHLLVRADPGEAIEEASEGNNDAAIVVPFGETLDLEVRDDDLALLSDPALFGRPVEFDIMLRNRGTVDSPPVTVRGDVVQGPSTMPVLDVLVQVPAGQTAVRRAAWLPGRPGPAQLHVSIDPAGQVAEAEEGNNAAQLDFDVVALDQPDLTFVGESLVFTPTPALEAQPLTAQLGVRNLSSVAAEEVMVALFAGDPASGAAMLGSTTIGPIAASSDVVATVGVPELALSGDQRLFVKIDADDRIAEVDESNNVVIKSLHVMSMPDLAISIADIELVPSLPVPGEAVQARVTVRNIGSQDAQGVMVRLLEGDVETGVAVGADSVVGFLPAGASAVLTWHWTLGISPGSRSVTAVADPGSAVREGSDANNIASLPFDVQDGDFFASERYISPNGDGVQDAVAVVFRSSGTEPVTVEINNGAGRTVRRYQNAELNEESRGQVIWDGRDDLGRVVTDGEYVVSVVEATGDGPDGDVLVTVDNDSSSLLEALDTPHGVLTDLRGTLHSARMPPAESPLRQHLFAIWKPEGVAEGLYRSDAYFSAIVPVISPGWLERFRLAHGHDRVRLEAFEFSPNGSRMAVILSGSGPASTWLLETAVDQVDAPVVLREGDLNRRVLGYLDERTLVAGAPAGGGFLVFDTLNGTVTEQRGFGGATQYNSTKAVPGGLLALQGETLMAFAPRDPAEPIVQFAPQDPDGGGGYSATLSPNGSVAAIHEYDRQTESISLFDLESGTSIFLAQAAPGLVYGEQSGQTNVVPRFGPGWLERRDQLLVQDAAARSLSVYSSSGQRLSLTAFPELQRVGDYAVNDDAPPMHSEPDHVLPSTFAALALERCNAPSSSAIGIERRIFDPAANRFFLGFGETVAWEYIHEAWTLTSGPGIDDYFSADVDSGQVDTVQTGTLIPLINGLDVATHPLREPCNDAPAPDWPGIILRDGARIRMDGRVQTVSHGVSSEPWGPGNEIVAIWPDDSTALLSDDRAYVSLLNLGALLRARTLGRGIELSGVAADRNFAYYRIDWAPIEHPNEWQALTPASEEEVFLDEFLTWVPPLPGTFLIRLTVADRAGNTVSTFATSSSFDSAAIDNFSLAPRYVSPNGDGLQDQVLVKYRVREPVTLAIRVADAQGNVVRSMDRTYTSAQLGPDEFTWNGRADDDAAVPDGRYRIMLGGFGAWVIVDTVAPVMTGGVEQAYQAFSVCHEALDCRAIVHVSPYVHFRAHDTNLLDALLETRPADGGVWREVHMSVTWPPLPAEFAAQAFRASAIDRAGNSVTAALGQAEDSLVLAGVSDDPALVLHESPWIRPQVETFDYQPPPLSQIPDFTKWQAAVVNFASPTDVLVVWNYAGRFTDAAVETAAVETPDLWIERSAHTVADINCNAQPCLSGADGKWLIPIDDSGLAPGSRHLLRIRAERADGARVYSNIGYILAGGIDAPRCNGFSGNYFQVSAEEHFTEAMSNAILHYRIDQTWESEPAAEIHDGRLEFHVVEERLDAFAWVEATDSSGVVHRSGEVELECTPAESEDPLPGASWRLYMAPKPVIDDRCDGLPSNRIALRVRLGPEVTRGTEVRVPDHVRFSYVDGITGGEVVRFEGQAGSPDWLEGLVGDQLVATEGWPEGEYEARLTLDYSDGPSETHVVRFPVVKQVPAIQIVAPGDGERVCATSSPSLPAVQTLPFNVDVLSPLASGYRIEIGSGSDPMQLDCMLRKGEAYDGELTEPPPPDLPATCRPYAEISGFRGHYPLGDAAAVTGDLVAYNGVSTLRLKAANWSGGTVCTEHSILLDSAIEFRERALPQTLLPYHLASVHAVGIAPTSGSSYSVGTFFLRSDEPVDVLATLHRTHRTPGTHTPVLDEQVLATLTNIPAFAGDLDLAWNGTISDVAAQDGLYGIKIGAQDDCAHAQTLTYWALVDSTPPVTTITDPLPQGAIHAPVVEIVGSATDNLEVRTWSLDFALAESPDAWQNLASGEGGLPQPALLASWSRASITGAVDLRLSAIDHLGNRSETHLPMVLGEPAALIGAATLQPPLFSPNADGVFDTTRLQLGLLRPASIDVRVVDAANGAVASLHSGPQPAGTVALPWNGLAGSGQVVADGTYRVMIDATDPEGMAAPESIALGATVDTTPPSVEIRQPAGEYAATTSFIEMRLADVHFARFEARLTRSADGVVVLSTSGTQAGDIVLTPLADFAEGGYALHVEASDAVGNSTARDIDFRIDSTQPAVVLAQPADGALVPSATATPVTGSVDDANLSGWTLEVAGETGADWTELAHGDANHPAGELLSWTPALPDGRYRLKLRAVDRAGNTAEVQHLVDVDGTPPVASITAPMDGGFLKADAIIEGTASDAHFGGYRLSVIKAALVDGGQWSDVYAGVEPVEAGRLAELTLDLDEDNYLLRLVVTDRVGLSSSQQVSVRIDARPPAAPIALVGRVEDNRDAVLDWQAVDAADLAGYVVYRDDQRLDGPLLVLPHYVDHEAPEGLPRYRVTAVDHAGNESAPSNMVSLLVDRTPPIATILRPVAGERVRGVYDITGTAHSADDFKEYRLTMQPLEPPGEVAVLAAATLAVQGRSLAAWDTLALADETSVRLLLEAEDIRGNIAMTDVVVTVDNGSPAAPTGLTAALAGADAHVHWNPNVESDLLGYLLYRDNELVNATGPTLPGDLRPFALTTVDYLDQAVPDGQHRYVVYAIDRAGNVSPPSDPALLDPLDNAPPSMTIESPLPGVRFETQITVLATSEDTDIADVRFAYRAEGSPDWIDIGAPLPEAPYRVTWAPAQDLPHGYYEIRALARDAGGRQDPEPPSVTVVYADLTPPPPPTDLVAHGDGDVVHVAWNASDAPDLAGYRVYRDDAPLDEVPSTALTLDDVSLADRSYTYAVKAFDTYGNESIPSNAATAHVFGVDLHQPYTPSSAATTGLTGSSARPGSIMLHVEAGSGTTDIPAGPTMGDGHFELPALELQPGANAFTLRVVDAQGNESRASTVRVDRGAVPSVPTGVELTVDDHQALLRWNANPEPDVIGYRVFRNGAVLEADRLLGEIPVATSDDGSDAAAAVDSDPTTAWFAYVANGDPESDWSTAELELAWVEPRIVAVVELLWSNVDAAAPHMDVLAWSGHAWVHMAHADGAQTPEQSISLAQPYRTTRMKLALHGSVETDNGSDRELSLAEVRLVERPLQGARNLAETLVDGSYAYQVSAISAFAFESPLSDAVVATIGDTEGPDAVVLTGELVGRDAYLEWTASNAPDIARYDLQRDGLVVASVIAGDAREHTDAGLSIGEHTYAVVAVDGGGNPGLPSNAVALTVEGDGPAIPVDLAVTAPPEGAALDVAWQPAPGSTPDHYILRRGASMDGPFEIIAEPTGTLHHDAPLVNGTTYYYTVEAVDLFGDTSGPGAPASGMPLDRLAPAPPLLTYPTVAFDRLHQYATTTDICGKSEAGAVLDLERAGEAPIVVVANQIHSPVLTALPPNVDYSVPAPDSRHVATVDYAGTRILDLDDSSTERIGPRSRLQVWAAHGLALYFVADDSDAVLRWERGHGVEPVPHPVTSLREFAVDAREARLAMIGVHAASGGAPSEGIWVVDRSGGSPRQIQGITSDALGLYPVLAWSPDGSHLLLTGDNTAWLIDAGVGDVVTNWVIDGEVLPVWSNDSRRVLYASLNADDGDDLHVLDIATQTGTLLTTGSRYIDALAWSPAGDEIAVLDQTGASILAWPSGSPLPLLTYNAEEWRQLAWTASGTIIAHGASSLSRIESPGWFCARSAGLVAGLNRWSARATDTSGNHGFASATIEVEVPGDNLPDLAIGEADVLVVPASGQIGQSYAAAVTLRNVGAVDVEYPEVAVDLDWPDGTHVALPGTPIPVLAPGQARTISYALGVLDMAGTYRIAARADPHQQVFESNEDNNSTVAALVVGADGTPVLEASLRQAVFAPGEIVEGEVGVTNPGPSFSGQVSLQIVDADDAQVADLGTHPIAMLGFGQRWTTPVAWEADAVLAGEYYLRATLRAAGDTQLAEQDVGFAIEAVRHIQLAVGTGTPVQIIGRDVVIHSELDFSDGNALLEGASLRLVVLDTDGVERWSREQALGTLLPGHTLARDDAWPTNGMDAGLYRLRLDLLSDDYNASADASVTLQDATPGISLSGSIAFEPGAPLIAGAGQLLHWQVTNHAPMELPNVQARLRLLAMPSQVPVGEVEDSFDLGAGTSHSSSLALSAPPLALAAHVALLEVRLPDDAADEWRLLAQQGFAVVDRMPPDITISSPLAGTMQAAVVPFRAVIRDQHSAVTVAEVSVDGGNWQPVSAGADGQYARGIAGLVDGGHALRVRARDSWDNEMLSDAVPFTVDATPPLIVITGVADGDLLNHAITPQVSISDAHLATTEILLDGTDHVPGTPIGLDGSHVLTVRAIDEAGNQSLRSVRFTIDRIPPVVEIVAPADGAVVGEATVHVDVQTEASADVMLATGAYQASLTADDQGHAGFDAVPLVLGGNHVEVTAIDHAGNIGLPAAINVTYEIVATSPLIGTLQPGVAELAHGAPLAVHVVAQNPNAVAMPAQTLRVRVNGPAMTELATSVLTHDFTPHETFDADVGFESTDWPLGTLTIALDLEDAGTWLVLDTRQLELVDRTPPLLALDAPLAESVLQSPLIVSATASDVLSGIADVDARIDGGDWLPLSNGSGVAWATSPIDLPDGTHAVELQAHDGAGNAATIAPVPFVIDSTPPLINISGVAEGDILAHSVSPKIDIFDAHLATSDVWLNGQPYAPGSVIEATGDYTLEVSATDVAGNASTAAVHFTLDLDAPGVVFLAPEPGAIVVDDTVDVIGRTESRAHVYLRVGRFSVDLDADAAGNFEVHAVPLAPGENTLVAHALDLAGNVGPESSLTVVRKIALEAAVEGEIGPLPSPLPAGAWLDVPYSVRNVGGIALAVVPLRFELRSERGGGLVAFDEFTLDLPLGAEWGGVRRLDTAAVVQGSYLLSMQAYLPNVGEPAWLVLDTAHLDVDADTCRHGDVIFADGFDGTGVRRDGVIFCDGFEPRAGSAIVASAQMAPWLGATVRLAFPPPMTSWDSPLQLMRSAVAATRSRPPRMSPLPMAVALPGPSRPPFPGQRKVAMRATGDGAAWSPQGKDGASGLARRGWHGGQQ